MSALQAARQSDLEHSGLDQDPVIEGFSVYETHTPQTADSNQCSWTGGWPECQWCLRATVHIHTLVRACWIPQSCTPQAKDLAEYTETHKWAHARAHCSKKIDKKSDLSLYLEAEIRGQLS